MSITNVYPVDKLKSFEDFCHLPNLMLSSMGYDLMDKPQSRRFQVLMKCYSLAVKLSCLCCSAFIGNEIYYMLMSDNFELAMLLRLTLEFIYALCAIMKYIIFMWNLKQVKESHEELKELFPKNNIEKIAHKVQQHFWPKWILYGVYFHIGAAVYICVSPPIASIVLYLVDIFKIGFSKVEFRYFKIYNFDYGFDHRSPLGYLVYHTIEVLHIHYIILYNMCSEIWILCFSLQLCMHFNFLIRTFDEYRPNEEEDVKDALFIADLVKKHQILLNLSHKINMAFGALLLLLLLSTAATLCCAGVYMITQGLGREFLEYAAFLPTAIGQYYLICYYGQQLTIVSQGIADAAYNHPWYNGSQSYKKSILIIIMRSQKEVELNAYGYQPICLEAFQMVMGATYRVFTLLKETMM